jgi:hypothetical protein
MSIFIRDSRGNGITLSSPYKDLEKYTEKSYIFIEIISGERSGEAAQIEVDKIYNSIMKTFDK